MAEDGLTQRYHGSNRSTDLLFLWLTVKAVKQIKTIPWGNITIDISPKNPVPGDKITITVECDNAYSIEANVTNPDGNSYGLIQSVTDSNQNGITDLMYEFTPETNKIYLLNVVADNTSDTSSDEYAKLKIPNYQVKIYKDNIYARYSINDKTVIFANDGTPFLIEIVEDHYFFGNIG